MKKVINFLINTNILIVSFVLSIFDEIYQRKIIRKFKELFNKEINMVFDVGAHRGEFTNLILKNFSINNMELFEPNPKSFEYLKNKSK